MTPAGSSATDSSLNPVSIGEKEVGRITSSAQVPGCGRAVGLALVAREHTTTGVTLRAEGGLEAQVKIETAQQKAALANYGQIALMAFSEVETGISNEGLLDQRKELLAIAVKQNRKALQVAKTQYEFGQVDFLSVLQMQARLLGSRIQLIRIKNAKLAQRVDLHLTLGGSFEN